MEEITNKPRLTSFISVNRNEVLERIQELKETLAFVEENSQKAKTYFEIALIYKHLLKDYGRCIRNLLHAEELESTDPVIARELILTYLKVGELGKAKRAARVYAHLFLGTVFERDILESLISFIDGKDELIEYKKELLEKRVALKPTDTLYLEKLEDLYRESHNYRKLDRLYKEYVQEFENLKKEDAQYYSFYKKKAESLTLENSTERKSLKKALTDGKRYESLLELLKEEFSLRKDPSRKKECAGDIAYLLEEKFGNFLQAAHFYSEAFSLAKRIDENFYRAERIYRSLGEIDKLIEFYRDSLKIVREEHELSMLRRMLSYCFEYQKKDPENLETLLVEMYNTNRRDHHTILRLLYLYHTGKKYEKLFGLLGEYTENLSDHNKEAFFNRYITRSNPSEQALLYERLLTLLNERENQIRILKHLGILYRDTLDDTQKCEVAFLEIFHLNPEDSLKFFIEEVKAEPRGAKKSKGLYFLGKLYEEELRDNAKASEYYLAAYECDQSTLEGLLCASRIYVSMKRFSEALKVLNLADTSLKASGKEKILVAILCLRAELLQFINEGDDARQDLERAQEIDPENSEVLIELGKVYYQKEKFLEARKVYRKLFDLFPSSLEFIEKLHELYVRANEIHELLGLYDIFLSKNKDKASYVYRAKGAIYLDKLNDLDKAIHSYEYALSLDPHDNELLRELALLAYKNKAWNKALIYLQKAMSRERDAERIAEYQFITGKVYLEGKKNPNEAKKLFEEAEKTLPESTEILHSIVNLLISSKKYDEAIERLERVSSPHVSLYIELAKLYLHKGGQFIDQAYKKVHEALRLDPFYTESYAVLGSIYTHFGSRDGIFITYSILDFFGKASEEQKKFLKTYREDRMLSPAKTYKLDEVVWNEVIATEPEKSALSHILTLLSPYFMELFSSPTLYALSPLEDISHKATHPLSSLFSEVKTCLAINEGASSLYQKQEDLYDIGTDYTSRPIIVVGRNFTNEHFSFDAIKSELAYYLWYVKRGLWILKKCNKGELHKVEAYILSCFDDKALLLNRDDIKQVDRLKKILGKKREELIETYGKEKIHEELSIEKLLDASEISAAKAGCVVSFDPKEALLGLTHSALETNRRSSHARPFEDAIQGISFMADALRFIASDTFLKIRRGMGISL